MSKFFGGEKPPHSEVRNNPLEIPKIYSLIESKAKTEDMVQQIYADFYSHNSEAVFLGLQEVQSRGHEGTAAFKFMGQSSDELGIVCRQLAEKPNMAGSELEKILGIKRFGAVMELKDIENEKAIAYEHAKKRGIINPSMSFSDFLETMEKYEILEKDLERVTGRSLPSQISGTLDLQLIIEGATFGSNEPAYLELVGPREILRLRSLPSGNFLLLGSMGKYSARDIKRYANKINPNITTNVVDIIPVNLQLINRDPEGPKDLVGADANELPYQDNSMDHIYSNHLFNYLDNDFEPDETERQVQQILREVARVLKPGGSFVLLERPFGHDAEKAVPYDVVMNKIRRMAIKAGLDLVSSDTGLSFVIQAESGSSRVDENGFAHYEDLLVDRIPTGIAQRYVKKA